MAAIASSNTPNSSFPSNVGAHTLHQDDSPLPPPYPATQETQSDGQPGTLYEENQYGEIDPQKPSDDSTTSHSKGFGEDTTARAEEFRSDEVYGENRYGELGRADTYRAEGPHLSDKIKGTAEQIAGKILHNESLVEKGNKRKSPSPPRT